jgi:IMP dehydrogenase
MQKSQIEEALTFGDVSLVPGHSTVLPHEVDVSINLNGKVTLKTPILSAAMDTVTTAPLAIALAQVGGIGVIHKNLSVEEQASEVFRVKKYQAWVIANPVTIKPDTTIAEAKILVKEQGVSSFPVLDENGLLLGMLTARDMRFAEGKSSQARELMTTNLIVARADADTKICLDLMKQGRVEKLPLIDDKNELRGLVTIKDIQKSHTFANAVRDSMGRLCCAAALGCGPDLEERAHALVNAGVDMLVLDSAHGHAEAVGQAVKKLRLWFKDILIIAGNVVTREAARFLHSAGADGVKVGVGPGSICTTRIVAGVGIPQLSAVMAVGQAAKEDGFFVVADGGMQFSGDIVKALAAGGHVIMTGSLLAGCKEAPGERIIYGGREFKVYRGMGSLGAMEKGSKDRYGQSRIEERSKFVPEGIEGRIPYRGTVADMVYQLLGGLRAGMGYVGAHNILELQEKARFVRITSAGMRESHVHDITITKEAPNYYFSNEA